MNDIFRRLRESGSICPKEVVSTRYKQVAMIHSNDVAEFRNCT